MAFTNQTLKSGPYDCNGSVVDFAGMFYCIDSTDITVTYTDTGLNEQELVLGVGYTMTTATSAFPTSSFSIQTVATYATGEKITISRNTPPTQEVSYGNSGPYLPKVHETSFDKSMTAIQELQEIVNRCVQFPISQDPGTYVIILDDGDTVIYTQLQDGSVTTAKLADDAVTYVKMQNVSATDKLLGRSTAGAGVVEEIACTAAGRALIDDASASAQRTTLGLGTMATQAASAVAITGGTIVGAGVLSVDDLYYIEDQKAANTGGGNPNGGTWNTRVLNTEVVNNITGASLSTNVITLPAGTYWVEAEAPCFANDVGGLSKLRLRQTDGTPASVVVGGGSAPEFSSGVTAVGNQVRDTLRGKFTIASAQTFELQHYISWSETNGLGVPANVSEVEVYANIKIWKVA